MRSTIIISCLALIGFAGCAYEGKVVAKQFRPFPFPDSLGVDGIYKFELRDQNGATHSQLVTAQVFASYEIGDYFDDFGTPPEHDAKDFKSMPAPFRNEPQEPPVPLGPEPMRARQPVYRPYHPVKTTSARPNKKSAAKIASKRHHSSHTVKTAKVSHKKKHFAHVAQRRTFKHHHASST